MSATVPKGFKVAWARRHGQLVRVMPKAPDLAKLESWAFSNKIALKEVKEGRDTTLICVKNLTKKD